VEPALVKYRAIKDQQLETTAVVAWEILRGPKLCGRVKEYDVALRFMVQLDIVPFTLTASRIAAEMKLD
jgi:predicted nucleic acid-binding protein